MIAIDYPKVIRRSYPIHPKVIRFGQKSDNFKRCKCLILQWLESFKKSHPKSYPKRLKSDNFFSDNFLFVFNGLRSFLSYPTGLTPKGVALRFRMRSRLPRGFMGKKLTYFRAIKNNGGAGE